VRTLFPATLLAAVASLAVAAPASADSIELGGCVDALGAVSACAFDSVTVYYDDEPIRRSFLSCLYGTPIDWDGVDVHVIDLGPEVTYSLPLVGDGTVVDWNLGDYHYTSGYFEGGPDLGGGCV